MDNLLFLLDKLKNDTNFPIEYQTFSMNDLNNIKDTNYNDYIIVLLFLFLECNFLDDTLDNLHDKEDEILMHLVNETKKGNYQYLYTITKIRNCNLHWVFREHLQKFITKLCSNLIPIHHIITNSMLKNINVLDTFTNMIIPLIIQNIDSQLLTSKLESKINECNNRIQELENLIYYDPVVGTEYQIAKNNFEQLVKSL
jgi:hypothetical protein